MRSVFKKDVLRGVFIQDMQPGSQIGLAYGASPSVQHAVNAKDYTLDTVYQVPMLLGSKAGLSWFRWWLNVSSGAIASDTPSLTKTLALKGL